MSEETPDDIPADAGDSETIDATPHAESETASAKPKTESTPLTSPSPKKQDTLLLFGKFTDRKSLGSKDKEELIKIIFDLNAELVRTTSRLRHEDAARAFKKDRMVKRFVRVPSDSGGTSSNKGQPPRGWQIILISSRSAHKPLGLEIWAPAIVGRREGASTPQIDLTEHDAVSLGVSRWHALIRPSKSGLFLTDLRSTNGTFCNGVRLQPSVARELKHNDTISFGQLVFRIRIVREPEQANP